MVVKARIFDTIATHGRLLLGLAPTCKEMVGFASEVLVNMLLSRKTVGLLAIFFCKDRLAGFIEKFES
jgi:hypothetical protein